jgi:hypothetical protein
MILRLLEYPDCRISAKTFLFIRLENKHIQVIL